MIQPKAWRQDMNDPAEGAETGCDGRFSLVGVDPCSKAERAKF